MLLTKTDVDEDCMRKLNKKSHDKEKGFIVYAATFKNKFKTLFHCLCCSVCWLSSDYYILIPICSPHHLSPLDDSLLIPLIADFLALQRLHFSSWFVEISLSIFFGGAFFKSGDAARFCIYVHPEPGFVLDKTTTKSAFFYGRQLNNSIQAAWGELSMIEAERLLFEEALCDPANQRFVLLSDSCVPLYNFSYIYNYVMSSPKSFVDSFTDFEGGRCYLGSMEVPFWSRFPLPKRKRSGSASEALGSAIPSASKFEDTRGMLEARASEVGSASFQIWKH